MSNSADGAGGTAAGPGPAVGQDGPLISVADAESRAAAVLPPGIWDFVAGGSGAELTQRANRAAFDDVFLVPRVLAGDGAGDPAATLAGCAAALPVAVAPMAYQQMVHADGEAGLATACAGAGIPYTTAMLSSTSIEQVAAAGGCLWAQLYWLRDRGVTLDFVRRAEAAGCRALMLTVDVPVMGRRLRDLRNGFALPAGVRPVNLGGGGGGAAGAAPGRAAPGRSAVAAHTAAIIDPALGWADVAWLQEQTRLPVLLKGVLDARDAATAAGLGVAGVVVSNHGGRQLDGAVPSITALPWIVAAVAGRCPVLLDSGVRSGTDVLKAVALGAAGVLLGRPVFFALAAGGAAGAADMLELLSREVRQAMLLAGCPDLAAVAALNTVTRSR